MILLPRGGGGKLDSCFDFDGRMFHNNVPLQQNIVCPIEDVFSVTQGQSDQQWRKY